MTSRRRPWGRTGVVPLVLSVVVSVLLVACGIPEDRAFRGVPESELPFGLDTPVTEPPTTLEVETDLAVLVFPSRSGMMPVGRALPKPIVLRDLIVALDDGPAPGDPPGLRTVVDSTLVRSAVLDAGVATLSLQPAVAELTASDQQTLVAQLVLTLTSRPGVGQVRFTVGNDDVDVPRADGSLVSGPVSRDDYASLLVR